MFPVYYIPQPNRYYLPVPPPQNEPEQPPAVVLRQRGPFGDLSNGLIFDYQYDPQRSGVNFNSFNTGDKQCDTSKSAS